MNNWQIVRLSVACAFFRMTQVASAYIGSTNFYEASLSIFLREIIPIMFGLTLFFWIDNWLFGKKGENLSKAEVEQAGMAKNNQLQESPKFERLCGAHENAPVFIDRTHKVAPELTYKKEEPISSSGVFLILCGFILVGVYPMWTLFFMLFIGTPLMLLRFMATHVKST